MALWNQRMFLLTGDGKYADVLERVVYNGLLSGVSLAGDRFFYVNPLGSKGKHHRQEWFDCACCPDNVLRYVAGIGDRVYAHKDNGIWTILYLGNTTTIPLGAGKVTLTQETRYPWDGDVKITVAPEKSCTFDLNLRVPGWCNADATITVNGSKVGALQRAGAPVLAVEWELGGVDPAQAKVLVLNYLEKPLRFIDGIKEVQSSSANGVWTVQAVLDDRTDQEAIRRQVTKLAKQAMLFVPPGVKPAALRPSLRVANGYVKLTRSWKRGDVVRLMLPMPVERVYADPHVKADAGRVALQRGPIVYCLEGVDNAGKPRSFALPKTAKLSAAFDKTLLGGVTVVRGEALAASRGQDGKRTTASAAFQAVPYYAWDNRAAGQMVVWLPETAELAEIAGEAGILSKGVYVDASHCNPLDTLAALNDGVLPKSSKDHGLPRMTWWDHQGTSEWVSYHFPQARRLSAAAVYWFDDTGTGRCRVPASWRLLYKQGSEWKEVQLAAGSAYGTAPDRFNEVSFEPVQTRELKLDVGLRPGFSGGILEWTVSSGAR
jgi:hypothetical protein